MADIPVSQARSERRRMTVIEVVKESGLRGRGGAYFPAALKWEGARRVDKFPKYLVVNSEEGEPGIFKDRLLMEAVPYRILEGMTIAAYATGVEQAYIYINAEAELSAQRVQHALDQARGNGLLGENILGTGYQSQRRDSQRSGGLRLRRGDDAPEHHGRVPSRATTTTAVPDRIGALGKADGRQQPRRRCAASHSSSPTARTSSRVSAATPRPARR